MMNGIDVCLLTSSLSYYFALDEALAWWMLWLMCHREHYLSVAMSCRTGQTGFLHIQWKAVKIINISIIDWNVA